MSVPFRIGVLQLSMEPLQQTVRMAQACDRAGFDIFWLAEAYPWWRKHGFEARSSTAMTAVIATQTQRIIDRLGNHFALHASSGADRHGSARDAGCRRRWPLPARTGRVEDLHEGDWRRREGKRRRPGGGHAREHRDHHRDAGGGCRRLSRQGVRGFGPGAQGRCTRLARACAHLRRSHRARCCSGWRDRIRMDC